MNIEYRSHDLLCIMQMTIAWQEETFVITDAFLMEQLKKLAKQYGHYRIKKTTLNRKGCGYIPDKIINDDIIQAIRRDDSITYKLD